MKLYAAGQAARRVIQVDKMRKIRTVFRIVVFAARKPAAVSAARRERLAALKPAAVSAARRERLAAISAISRSLLKFVKQRETRSAASREPLSPSFSELLAALFKSRLKVSLAAPQAFRLCLSKFPVGGVCHLQLAALKLPQPSACKLKQHQRGCLRSEKFPANE